MPQLGLWVIIDFPASNSKYINNMILNNYKDVLTSYKVGYSKSIGIYTTEKGLEKITWKNHYEDWYLWLDRPVGDIQNIQKLLTPDMFAIS